MKLGVMLSMFPEPHETFILRELAELQRQGVDLEIFSIQRPRAPVHHPAARCLQARTHYAPLLGASPLAAAARAFTRDPRRLLSAVARMGALCCRRPLDLAKNLAVVPIALHFGRVARARGVGHLHGHWRNVPTTACWLLQQINGLPWSAAIHGEDVFSPNPFLRRKLSDARFTVVCTRYSWRFLRECMRLDRPGDLHLNYHGLDRTVRDFAASHPRPVRARGVAPLILCVGRLFEFKGHDYLLRALRLLHRQGLAARLRIIGRGPRAEHLRRLAAGLGLRDHVEFLGLRPLREVLAHMLEADVLCQPSVYLRGDHFDGIPNVLAEAMALGTPVVSTRVSGIPELVEHGRSGLLAEERDAAGLARELARVLRDARLARSLAAAGQHRVREMFDQERNVGDLIRIFARYGVLPPDGGRAA